MQTGAIPPVKLLSDRWKRNSVDNCGLTAASTTTTVLVLVRSRQNVPQSTLLCRRQHPGVMEH